VNVSVRNEAAAKKIKFYMLLSCLCVVDAYYGVHMHRDLSLEGAFYSQHVPSVNFNCKYFSLTVSIWCSMANLFFLLQF
jgi:hypothetical protein